MGLTKSHLYASYARGGRDGQMEGLLFGPCVWDRCVTWSLPLAKASAGPSTQHPSSPQDARRGRGVHRDHAAPAAWQGHSDPQPHPASFVNGGGFVWVLPTASRALLSVQLPHGRLQAGYSPFALGLGRRWASSIPGRGVQDRAPRQPSHSTHRVQTQPCSFCTWFSGCCSTRLDFQPCGSLNSISIFPSLTRKSPAAQP